MRGIPSRFRVAALLLLALLAPFTSFGQNVYLLQVTNTTWGYHSNKVDPAYIPADAWTGTTFDDSSWPRGKGLFGREDVIASYAPWTINTYIPNPRSDDNPPTVAGSGPLSSYFRTHFTWS